MGIMQAGAVTVPIYPTISDDDYVYILNNAEVKILFVGNAELFMRMKNLQSRVSSLREIFTFDNVAGAPHWSEFLQREKNSTQDQVNSISEKVNEEDLSCLIYTSGTTGFPKGVMLTHKNLVSNLKAVSHVLPINETHTALSFLPLNHVFEKLVVYAYFMKGVAIYYAESMETIGDNIREVKPHFFTAVPRLLEKVYERIIGKALEAKGIKRALFFWAKGLAERYDNQKPGSAWYRLQLGLARKIVFRKVLAAMGGNLFALVSGAAPLNQKIARFFSGAGIQIMEGYGLTETSPVITVNHYERENNMIGSTGPVIPGVEIKIAADEEILCKGPNVMKGYYKLPDETAKVITPDGWFMTGDIGTIVNGKFLKITDRKKELFKTSGGKYVAPQPIENKFKESALIEQMMVVGNNLRFVTALIVPTMANLKTWCERNNIPFHSAADAIKQPAVMEKFQQIVDEYNNSLGHVEQIKRFTLLPAEWTVPGGHLTPTMKLKRKVILEKHKSEIEAMYA
jgi:long-chain acyl-CoA synthetase